MINLHKHYDVHMLCDYQLFLSITVEKGQGVQE